MSSNKFHSLNLHSEMLKNLDLLGFSQMTEIQSKALPHVLAGKDIIAQAQTGSGKTVAFGLGVVSQVIVADYYIQSLILCPTRELADQVATEIRKLARLNNNFKVLLLCGGSPIGPQIGSLEHGAHVIVGTPGRVLDHLSRRNLDLRSINTLVLDEADRMLDMGFSEDISSIISRTPMNKQTMLFSATFPDNIKNMSRDIQHEPVHVKTDNANINVDIDQFFYETKKNEWDETLISLIDKYRPESSIIFCTTKIQCDDVARYLISCGISALAIHGDLEQYERNEVMARFANGSGSMLVATDVAARGIDIKDRNAVINYQISRDPEVHVHRVGRTGRAGQKGLAISLYNRSEVFRVKAIEELTGDKYERDLRIPVIQNTKINLKPDMVTIKINGGKKNKLRPGDILGALTKDIGIEGKFIGKINIYEFHAFVAVQKHHAVNAAKGLERSKIKNRTFRSRILD